MRPVSRGPGAPVASSAAAAASATADARARRQQARHAAAAISDTQQERNSNRTEAHPHRGLCSASDQQAATLRRRRRRDTPTPRHRCGSPRVAEPAPVDAPRLRKRAIKALLPHHTHTLCARDTSASWRRASCAPRRAPPSADSLGACRRPARAPPVIWEGRAQGHGRRCFLRMYVFLRCSFAHVADIARTSSARRVELRGQNRRRVVHEGALAARLPTDQCESDSTENRASSNEQEYFVHCIDVSFTANASFLADLHPQGLLSP